MLVWENLFTSDLQKDVKELNRKLEDRRDQDQVKGLESGAARGDVGL